MVGNPANTNALIALTNAPSIPKENFTALTRLDQNRARAQVAIRTNVAVTAVHDVHIWGNHSATPYPDLDHGVLDDVPSPGRKAPIPSVVTDTAWVRGTFIPLVQQRGAAILAARQASSAMSAAKAISDHVHDWVIGNATVCGVFSEVGSRVRAGRRRPSFSPEQACACRRDQNETVSMGVYTDGTAYGIPKGLIFSFPLKARNGYYTIVRDLPLSDYAREMLAKTTKELLEEKAMAGV